MSKPDKIHVPPTVEEEEEPLDELSANIKMIQDLASVEGLLPSPIDINVTKTSTVIIDPLVWTNYEKLPKKMKITNTGQTLVLSAKWHSERPYITGGSLNGKYVFSQLHFHWGKGALEGSEHTIDGNCQPLEMHAIHYKSAYVTQTDALNYKDGVISVTYFFEVCIY